MTKLLTCCALLSIGMPMCAQWNAGGSRDVAQSVHLRLLIVLEGHKEPYTKEVHVAVFDGWGNPELVQSTSNGYVDLYLSEGLHRVQVMGPEIDPYFDEFTLSPGGGLIHTVEVRPRTNVQPTGPPTTPSTAVVRLNIPKNARRQFEAARRSWKKKDLQATTRHLNRAIALYPKYDEAYAARGELELAAGDRAHGEADLLAALKWNADNVPAARSLAELYITRGDYPGAEPFLSTVLRAEPENAWALAYAAWGDLQSRKLSQAIALAQRATSVPHKGYEAAYLIDARALELAGRFAEARAACQRYLVELPNGKDAAQAEKILQRLAH